MFRSFAAFDYSLTKDSTMSYEGLNSALSGRAHNQGTFYIFLLQFVKFLYKLYINNNKIYKILKGTPTNAGHFRRHRHYVRHGRRLLSKADDILHQILLVRQLKITNEP